MKSFSFSKENYKETVKRSFSWDYPKIDSQIFIFLNVIANQSQNGRGWSKTVCKVQNVLNKVHTSYSDSCNDIFPRLTKFAINGR